MTCVQDTWTQFWAVPAGEGRWRIAYAARNGMHYAERVDETAHSEADTLALLEQRRGTRGSC